MTEFSDLLLARMQAWDPEFSDADGSFSRQVLAPLQTYLGDNVTETDARELFLQRAQQAVPDLDSTVLADLVGKVVMPLVRMVRFETRSARSRLRLDDPSLITPQVLAEGRDVFYVEPDLATFARGTFRVFFSRPRTITVDVSTLIRVPGPPLERLYRPVVAATYDASVIRQQQSEGLFYIDIEVRATNAGSAYRLGRDEGRNASGITGATRITNPRAFTGGSDGDDATDFRARILTSVRLRSLATVAGFESVMPTLGYTQWYVSVGGDPYMIRDRVYGATTISSIPGGFVEPYSWPDKDEEGVSIGIANDVWVPAPDARVIPFQLKNLRDEGILLLEGLLASLSAGTGLFTAQVPTRAFFNSLPDDDLFAQPLRVFGAAGAVRRMSTETDIALFSGQVNAATGIYTEYDVTAYGSDSELSGLIASGTETAFESEDRRIRLLRKTQRSSSGLPESSALPESVYPFYAVPLYHRDLFDSAGRRLSASGLPVVNRFGTTEPDRDGSALVPRSTNYFDVSSSLPILRIERIELVDPLSDAETGEYIYHGAPLHAEYIGAEPGLSAGAGTVPVRVRFHLHGPQAAACGPGMTVVAGAGLPSYDILYWGSDDSWTYEVVNETGSTSARSAFLQISAAIGTELRDNGGNIVYDSTGPRKIRPGDWVVLLNGAGTMVQWALPIQAVVTTDAGYPSGLLQVFTQDLPVGETGRLYVCQGTSRTVQLDGGFSEALGGRQPEGTYYFDVFAALSSPSGDVISDTPPPANTPALFVRDHWLHQGFDIVSYDPGLNFSVVEKSTLLFHNGFVADGEKLDNRTIIIHAPSGEDLVSLQQTIAEDDDFRTVSKSVIAKQWPPVYVTCAFFYEGSTLSPETAAQAVRNAFTASESEQRIELSDLTSTLSEAGATYIVSGRIFAAQQDHLREWHTNAERGAIPLGQLSNIVPEAIVCVRLRDRTPGEDLDELDPENWAATHILRYGDFDAD